MKFQGEITWWEADGREGGGAISVENGWEITESTLVNRQLGIELKYRIEDGKLIVPLEQLAETGNVRVHELTLLPELITTDNPAASLVLPQGSGMLIHCRGHERMERMVGVSFPWDSHGLLTVFGVTGGGKTRMLLVDGGRHDFLIRTRTNFDGKYSLAPAFRVRDIAGDEPLREELSLVYREFDGGYETIATFYRDYMARKYALPTLEEKFKTSPVAEYNSRALLMRCRLAVKTCPPPILEQTPEHQPPLGVFMTFEDVRTLIDECKRQGLGPLDCCLVGWNYGGHDGAYPQIFPVEAALGGEEELVKTIDHVKAAGYAVGLHDNYFDSYTISEYFDWNDLNREADLSPSMSGRWGGGLSRVVCPVQAYRNAVRNLTEVKKRLPINGTYFTDVVTVWPLQKCYDRKHPLTRGGCAEWRRKTLQLARELFGCIMSEGAHDWALPALDRCYCLIGTDALPVFCDEEIPLFQMTWHGYLVYNTYRNGINRYPGSRLYLRNIAFGGMPMVYWHYIFNPEQKFPPEQDLKFSPDTLPGEVAKIKRITDDLKRLEPLRTAFITGYREIAPGVTETLYSNGLRCRVNYNEAEISLPDSQPVPPLNFIIFSKGADL